MKSAAVVGLTILFSSLFLAAQNEAQNVNPSQLGPTVVQVSPLSSPCPVGMRVRQGIGTQMLQAKDGQRTRTFASRLRLNLFNSHEGKTSTEIVKATVTVRGLNGKAGMIPALGSDDRSSEVIRTMTVSFALDDDNSYWTDLVLPGLTSARMVNLESVTYADGSTWNFRDHVGWCQAAPDPLMLISGR